MEKKKLKKLELKKQTIVDLSDSEAVNVKGGTTLLCITAGVTIILSYTHDTGASHTGAMCGGCSNMPGDTHNCTACDCPSPSDNCPPGSDLYCYG